jgi:plastocyanin
MMRANWRLVFLMATAMLGGSVGAQTPAGDAIVRISMKAFSFAPATLTVKAGSTVTWVNTDPEPHTVVSDTGAFRSGALDTDESFTYRFTSPGTYRYFCTLHPSMMGTIQVE